MSRSDTHRLYAAGEASERLQREYEDCLRVQRALGERSIYHCWRFGERFLTFRFKDGAHDLAKPTPGPPRRNCCT